MNRNAFDSFLADKQEYDKKQLREQAAIAAMSGLLANSANTAENCGYAEEAVKRADQLLYALGYSEQLNEQTNSYKF